MARMPDPVSFIHKRQIFQLFFLLDPDIYICVVKNQKTMKDKEVVQLYGKTFIYYSNIGLVYRHPTKILWKERNLPENKGTIDALVKKVRDAISEYRKNNGINPPRDHVRSILRGQEPTQPKSLMDYYNEFLAFKKEQVDKGELRPTSMSDITSLKSALQGFEEQTKTKFHLSDINEDFIGKFKEYLLTIKKVSENTAQKRINSLKVFLKYFDGLKT